MLRVHTAALASICYDTGAKNNQRCHWGRWTVHWCVHRGRTNKAAFIYCGFTTPSVRHVASRACLLVFCRSLQLSLQFYLFHYFPNMPPPPNPPALPSEQRWLLVISKWSQLRFLQIQKPFGWLEPLGSPYIMDHMSRHQHAGGPTPQHKGCFPCFVCNPLRREKMAFISI